MQTASKNRQTLPPRVVRITMREFKSGQKVPERWEVQERRGQYLVLRRGSQTITVLAAACDAEEF